MIRSDPRDRRFAYFQDPDTHQWHTLRWTGLPLEGEILAFGDARAAELLRAAKAAGLGPRSDAELLPLLLELIGGHIPVDAWPTQMPKKKRKDHAREVLQAQGAAADRPESPQDSRAQQRNGTVVPMHQQDGWKDRAHEVASAVDDERRRRRRDAAPGRPAPPPPLSSRSGRRNLFALPHDDADDQEPV